MTTMNASAQNSTRTHKNKKEKLFLLSYSVASFLPPLVICLLILAGQNIR